VVAKIEELKDFFSSCEVHLILCIEEKQMKTMDSLGTEKDRTVGANS